MIYVPQKVSIPEIVIVSILERARLVAGNSRDQRSSWWRSIVQGSPFKQVIGVLALSTTDGLVHLIDTLPARRFTHLVELQKAGFCDVVTGEGVEACRGAYGLLRELPYWRLLPYSCWIEPTGTIVVFDRYKKPIVRLDFERAPEILPPTERIEVAESRWFYEDAIAPYVDPSTEAMLYFVAELCGTLDEIRYRWALSEYGRISHEIWTKSWRRQK